MSTTKLRKSPSGPTFDGNAIGDVVTWNGTEWVPLPPAGGNGDHKVLVSATDTTPGYLQEKLVSGFNIQVNLLNAGGNEQLEIASNPC